MKATQHMDGGSGRPFAAAAASDGGFQAGYYRSRIKQYQGALCTIFTILLTIWKSQQKMGY